MSTPPDSAAALAAIEKAAAEVHGSLHAPSVLEEAAELLADLWATGERHGVSPDTWGWTTDLPGGALSVISHRHTQAPKPERTVEEVQALRRELLGSLTELGLSAHLDPRSVVVDRLPETPRGGLHGDARLAVGIWTNGGWDLAWDFDRSPVVRIVAPASAAGAAEVAAIVRGIARGERPNPFRGR